MADELTGENRLRAHERLQQAGALVRQVEDELPYGHEMKQDLYDFAEELFERAHELLGAVRYEPVDELAKVISDLDEEEPFLGGGDDDEDLFLRSPRRVAERILARLHGRTEDVAPSTVGGDDG